MTVILFWDIDGTLLTTGRAGIFAWEEAAAAILGRPVDFASLETAGLTDIEIGGHILARMQGDASCLLELVRAYETALPRCLPRRQGSVLPGVRPLLDHLRTRADVLSLLLTGNTAAGARAKLAHYGLADYFPWGAFSDGAPDRPAIAHRALALIRTLTGAEPPLDRTYVIGDTPRDILCAQAIGARAIAVASGTYSAEALERHRPWWVLESLPEPATFLERLDGIAA
jgi:phosphoglycolate phosphatase-like HAD superfamily hydrolase